MSQIASIHRAIRLVGAVTRRDLRTVRRTRAYLGLALVFAAIAIGVVLITDGAERGYVPTIYDLLGPIEILVPILALALGYRAILGDATRGELDMLRTYPVSPWQIVAGTVIGRSLAAVVIVAGTLTVVGVMVALTPADTVRIFATHETADSSLFFVRFVVLSSVFALVFVAIAVAISSIARSTRLALALAAGVLLIVLVGFEVAVVRGLSAGWIDDDHLSAVLALAPHSAFRGLVLETATGATADGPRAASPVGSALGLLLWFAIGFVVATIGLRRQ